MLKKIFHLVSYAGYVAKNFSSRAKKQFYSDFNFVKKKRKMSSLALYADIISSSIKYNMSPLEFFKLRLYDRSHIERSEYMSARFLRKFQFIMNPEVDAELILDKTKFLTHFKDFAGRRWATLNELQNNTLLAESFLQDGKGKVVIKNSRGMSGKQVKVVETKGMDVPALLQAMTDNKFDLLEEYIIQHDDLMKMAPRGLNTVRIISQTKNNEVIIIGTCLKLSVYDSIDNLNSGNVAMPVDILTGVVTDAGIFLDIKKDDIKTHPLTGESIIGFQVPFWKESIDMVKKAAMLTPENKSIGWDVAITNNGPLLIEGNHDWGHDILQMSYRKGFKKVILSYMEN